MNDEDASFFLLHKYHLHPIPTKTIPFLLSVKFTPSSCK